MKKEINSLEEFNGWDDIHTEEDFFAEIEKNEEPSENIEESEDNKDSEDNKSENKEEAEDDLFKDLDDEENQEESENNEKPESQSINTLTYLKNKGLIDLDNEDLNEEEAEELIETKFEEAIENKIKEIFEDLPEVVRDLNKFVINGGNIQDFLNSVSKTTTSKITDDIDLDDEENQELVIREMLKEEGNDEEEIEAQVEYYKDSGRLKSLSEKKFKKWKEKNKKEKEKLLEQQEEYKRLEKENLRKARKDTDDFLKKNDEIGDLKFTKEDKKTLTSYVTDKTFKLQNGTTITRMQKELFYDIPQNKKAFMQLASLLNNRNEDGTFNFDIIKKKTETKITKEIKDNIRRSKSNIPDKSKSDKPFKQQKSLADYF